MLGQHAMMKLYNIFAQLSRPFWTNSKVIWRTMVWLLQRIFNGDDYDHCTYRLTNLKSSGAFSAKIFFMGVQSTDYVFLLLNLLIRNKVTVLQSYSYYSATLGGIASICFKFHFQTDYQQTLRIQIQWSQGCQNIRKIVRNLKLSIARLTIHLIIE